jgi:hypothetical protein
MNIAMDKESFCSNYLCPICRELLVSPVMLSDGHTYCNACIDKLLEDDVSYIKSPLTGEKIKGTIIPNITMKKQIIDLIETSDVFNEMIENFNS